MTTSGSIQDMRLHEACHEAVTMDKFRNHGKQNLATFHDLIIVQIVHTDIIQLADLQNKSPF